MNPSFFFRLKDVLRRSVEGLAGLFRDKPFSFRRMDYEEYWRQRGPSPVKYRYRVMARWIPEGASVLDIGCGDGALLEFLAKEKRAKGAGYETSLEGVRLARQKGLDVRRADVDSPDFRPEGTYDFIVLSEVLEHLARPEDLLLALRDRFRQSLLISFPNVGYLPHRLRLLFGRFPVQWAYHPGEHLRFWSAADFRHWLAQLGFRPHRMHVCSGIPRLAPLYPSLLGDQILYEVKRAEGNPPGGA